MLHRPEKASSPIRTKYGEFVLHVFSWSENEQDNVLVLERAFLTSSPLVRIQSACYTGEIFDSLDCDCHWQLETSLMEVQSQGGLFLYMLRDGRGAGLLTKVRGMHLSSIHGLDTAEAYKRLGVPADPRNYQQAVYVLRSFDLNQIRLFTNNPRKVRALEEHGFDVTRISIESTPTAENKEYLKAKASKLGHMMKAFGTNIND